MAPPGLPVAVKARVEKAIAFLGTIKQAQIDGTEGKGRSASGIPSATRPGAENALTGVRAYFCRALRAAYFESRAAF
jgi:hypothetical protein